MDKKIIKARTIIPGKATGRALVVNDRVGFLGFIDYGKGTFTGAQEKLKDAPLKDAVLIFRAGKAATGGARAIDLAVRSGYAPAAMVNLELDPVTVAGCAMNEIPMLLMPDESVFQLVSSGDVVTVDADTGALIVLSGEARPACKAPEPIETKKAWR